MVDSTVTPAGASGSNSSNYTTSTVPFTQSGVEIILDDILDVTIQNFGRTLIDNSSITVDDKLANVSIAVKMFLNYP